MKNVSISIKSFFMLTPKLFLPLNAVTRSLLSKYSILNSILKLPSMLSDLHSNYLIFPSFFHSNQPSTIVLKVFGSQINQTKFNFNLFCVLILEKIKEKLS